MHNDQDGQQHLLMIKGIKGGGRLYYKWVATKKLLFCIFLDYTF